MMLKMIWADKVLQEIIKTKNIISIKDFKDSLTQENIAISPLRDLRRKQWIRSIKFKIKGKNSIILSLEKFILINRNLKLRAMKAKKKSIFLSSKILQIKWAKNKKLKDHGLNLCKLFKPLSICKMNSRKLMFLEKEFLIFIIHWTEKSQDMEKNLSQLNQQQKFKFWLKDLILILLKPLNNLQKFKKIQLTQESLEREFQTFIILWMEKSQVMERILNQLNLSLKFKYWHKDHGLILLKPLNNPPKFKKMQLTKEFLERELQTFIIHWTEKSQVMENNQHSQNQPLNRKFLLN